jgi:hypothetical protein
MNQITGIKKGESDDGNGKETIETILRRQSAKMKT